MLRSSPFQCSYRTNISVRVQNKDEGCYELMLLVFYTAQKVRPTRTYKIVIIHDHQHTIVLEARYPVRQSSKTPNTKDVSKEPLYVL